MEFRQQLLAEAQNVARHSSTAAREVAVQVAVGPDTHNEQRALHSHVFPFVEQLCTALGLRFSAQCRPPSVANSPALHDISAAFASPGPAFLCILGDALDHALPLAIPASDFLTITNYLEASLLSTPEIKLNGINLPDQISPSNIYLLKQWYVLNTNTNSFELLSPKITLSDPEILNLHKILVNTLLVAAHALDFTLPSPLFEELKFADSKDTSDSKKVLFFHRIASHAAGAPPELIQLRELVVPDELYELDALDAESSEQEYLDLFAEDVTVLLCRAILDQYHNQCLEELNEEWLKNVQESVKKNEVTILSGPTHLDYISYLISQSPNALTHLSPTTLSETLSTLSNEIASKYNNTELETLLSTPIQDISDLKSVFEYALNVIPDPTVIFVTGEIWVPEEIPEYVKFVITDDSVSGNTVYLKPRNDVKFKDMKCYSSNCNDGCYSPTCISGIKAPEMSCYSKHCIIGDCYSPTCQRNLSSISEQISIEEYMQINPPPSEFEALQKYYSELYESYPNSQLSKYLWACISQSVELFTALASENHIPSLLKLSELNSTQNPILGFEYASKAYALDPENPDALHSLGKCLIHGIGCPVDTVSGESMLRKSGDVKSELEVIKFHVKHGTLLDSPNGDLDADTLLQVGKLQNDVDVLLKAAELGNAEARYLVAMEFEKKGEFEGCVAWMRKAAESGNVDAVLKMGLFYKRGVGVKQYPAVAVKYFERAMEMGNVQALYELAECYVSGKGVLKDPKTGVKLYTRAVSLGHFESMYKLGICYYFGIGVDIDQYKAFELYTRAKRGLETRHPGLTYHLGIAYRDGTCGVQQDMDKSLELFEISGSTAAKFEAAKLCMNASPEKAKKYLTQVVENSRNPEAWYLLAMLLESGSDKVSSLKNAVEGGVLKAWYYLAECFENGDGCDKDTTLAVEYYCRCVQGGVFVELAKDKLGAFLRKGDCTEIELRKIRVVLEEDEHDEYLEVEEYEEDDRDEYIDVEEYEEHQEFEKSEEVEDLTSSVKKCDSGLSLHESSSKHIQSSYTEYMAQNPPPSDPIDAYDYYTIVASKFNFAPLAHFKLGEIYQTGVLGACNYSRATQCFRTAADQGHTESQYNIAVCFELGRGVSKNMEEAVKYYTMASESTTNPHPLATFKLAQSYRNGTGVVQDTKEYTRLLQKASNLNNLDATYELAKLYQQGSESVGKSESKAVELYRVAAYQGHPEAQLSLGKCYMNGIGGIRQPNAAAKYFEKAADQGGLHESEYELAKCYLSGFGVPKDPVMAVKYLKRAATNGWNDARYTLAMCFESGVGVQKSAKLAVEYLRLAADQGHPQATCKLGVKYLMGDDDGMPRYPVVAVKYFERAAEQKLPEGEYLLAECYRNGDGVPKDPITALKLYQRAASQNHPGAQYQLGVYYFNGIGVSKDTRKAVDLYKTALKSETIPSALYSLGICLRDGIGTRRDPESALDYLERAAQLSHCDANYETGVMYRDGEGALPNPSKALEYFKSAADAGHVKASFETALLIGKQQSVKYFMRAAEFGDVEAQYRVGLCFEYGEGVYADSSVAVEWYRRSVEGGRHAMACFRLAEMTRFGDGTKMDLEAAVKLYEQAANMGVVEAQVKLMEVKKSSGVDVGVLPEEESEIGGVQRRVLDDVDDVDDEYDEYVHVEEFEEVGDEEEYDEYVCIEEEVHECPEEDKSLAVKKCDSGDKKSTSIGLLYQNMLCGSPTCSLSGCYMPTCPRRIVNFVNIESALAGVPLRFMKCYSLACGASCFSPTCQFKTTDNSATTYTKSATKTVLETIHRSIIDSVPKSAAIQSAIESTVESSIKSAIKSGIQSSIRSMIQSSLQSISQLSEPSSVDESTRSPEVKKKPARPVSKRVSILASVGDSYSMGKNSPEPPSPVTKTAISEQLDSEPRPVSKRVSILASIGDKYSLGKIQSEPSSPVTKSATEQPENETQRPESPSQDKKVNRRQSMIQDLTGALSTVAGIAAKSLGLPYDKEEVSEETRSMKRTKRASRYNSLLHPVTYMDYMNKYPPPKDPMEAVEYYSNIVALYEDDAPIAHFELGKLYERGIANASKEVVASSNLAIAAKHYQKAASQGHTEAQFRLAVFLENGKGGLQRNFAEAVKYYTLAAEGDGSPDFKGHVLAISRLAECYRNGDGGVPKDPRESARLLRKASDMGLPDAMYRLGECMAKGEGVEVSNAEAARLYRLAAYEGHARAQCALGRCYLNGEGIARYPAAAFKFFEKAAAQGLAEAEFELGRCYQIGNGIAKDPLMAVKLLNRAALKGHVDARYYLATCYDKGIGVEKNKEEAVRMFKLASDEGHAKATYRLGMAYLNGEGLPRYPVVAVKFFERAAEQKLAEGEFMLAECYRKGTGVPKDPLTALKLYQRASQQGHAGAQVNLGIYYSKGIGVPTDAAKAVEYYNMALEKENIPSALHNLGISYRDGAGVTRDIVTALKYFEEAAIQNHWGACYEAGCCYRDGEGTTRDINKALSYFKAAADGSGHAGACYEAGILLSRGGVMGNRSQAFKYFGIAAEAGDAEAQYQVGRCYEQGEGVPADSATAIHWYRQSASSGNAPAQYKLGVLLENGDGVARNLNEALKCYESAANKGIADAQFRLAELYESGGFGKLVKPDHAISLSYYHQAANRGHSRAQNILGHLYFSGKGGVQRDVHIAFSYLTQAAEKGIAEAQFRLGVLYETGEGAPQDMNRAAELYRKAGKQNHPEAQRALGMCYERGEGGLEKNDMEAFRLYEACAGQGLPSALVNLARCFEEGIGTERNVSRALELYQRAADMGDAHAQFNLAAMAERGEPVGYVEVDTPLAIKYYEKAATQGLAAAMFNLAVMLETGQGVPEPDEKQAIQWYEKAASEGVAAAQVNLARRYEVGDGVPKDIEMAVQFYHKAANRGDPHAQCVLGTYYRAGKVVQQDSSAAASFFQLAADHGLPEAKFRLAVLYEQGEGVVQSYEKAVELYRQAVEDGNHTGSKVALAKIYYNGVQGITADMELALELYRSAADEGDPFAAFTLANALESGDVQTALRSAEQSRTGYTDVDLGPIVIPTEDFEAAIAYYQLAAEGGMLLAKFRLAMAFYEGRGSIPPNPAAAIPLLIEASNGGLSDARIRLAECYEHGIGVIKNISKAIEWYKSVADTDPLARQKVDELSPQVMTGKYIFQTVRKWFA